MNRKLHNTILALTVTGMVLFLGLVVARPPVQQAAGQVPALATDPAAPADGRDEPLDGLATRAGAPARAPGQEAGRAADTAQALAMAVGTVATTAAGAALASTLAGLDGDAAPADEASPARGAEGRARPRRASSTRDLIAIPYFSFARGARGTGRS